jgi:hypothetical protein
MSAKHSNVTLSQSVSNPVGNGDNTDSGPRDGISLPGPENGGEVYLVPGVCNPVGSALNTDKGVRQAPLPMRPIPS